MRFFEGLYTFDEVSSMYEIDQSTLTHSIGSRFIENEDVKKLEKTWVVREKALERGFRYIPKVISDEVINIKKKPGRKSTIEKCREAYLNSIL